MKNNAINTYLKELSKQPVHGKEKRNTVILKNRSNLNQNSAALKYEDIVEQFGSFNRFNTAT